MAVTKNSSTNVSVTATRKVSQPLGFTERYNFVLWFIFAGAMMGFCISRFKFFDFHGVFCSGGPRGTLPGDCYWYYKELRYQVGIRLHLMAVLPASFSACFQFVPAIRNKSIFFHRFNGYLVTLLVLAGNVGGLMIARHAAGGGLDTQSMVVLLAIVTTGSLVLALYHIKRLQLDQHRAWMLRAWCYLGTPVTARFIIFIMALMVSKSGNYYQVRPCAQIEFIFKSAGRMLDLYPECMAYTNGTNADLQTMVHADLDFQRPDKIAAAIGAPFGTAVWLSFALHAIVGEFYIQLTPKEAERLRQISYQRQHEAGFHSPDDARLKTRKGSDSDSVALQERYKSQ